MANNFLTMQMITNEALAIFMNECVAVRYVNRQYDSSFGKTGAKIGDTLNIRKPPRFQGRSGNVMSPEDIVETSTPLQLSQLDGVDMQFNDVDRLLRMDNFRERYIRPAVIRLANTVDTKLLAFMANNTFNSVGGAGQPPTKTIVLQAGSLLDKNSAPRSISNWSIIWGPDGQASMVDSLSGLFNAAPKISEQYNTGTMGVALGFKNSMDQNVLNRVVGPLGGTPQVNGAGQTGNALVTAGWTAAAGQRLAKGDVFTIAGVYLVNPVSRQLTNQLQNFVVTADVSSDAAGNATIPISPAITPTGQFQNVSAAPANNAAITVRNSAGAFTVANLAFHKEAFTLACADLLLPAGVHEAARASDEQTGLSIRLIQDFDTRNNQMLTRLDILYGYAALYPEWSVRIDS